jgi:uncharacterized protein
LHKSCKEGRIQVTNFLIENNANISATDRDGCQPLGLACWHGHAQVAALLLQHNADIHAKDNRGWTAFHRALRGGSSTTELLSILLDHQANINEVDSVC